ncbi:MAG: hypothetical protein K940chlam9_00250 [Chlamydiae bacterium]|nr:hypothetical protein [Chlamydiota bacterium]
MFFLSDEKKAGQAKYFIEIIDALLQRNYPIYNKAAYLDLLAFQAIVTTLHQEVLDSKIGNLVKNTLQPIAAWGKVPFTYYLSKGLDKEIFGDFSNHQVTIVKLPFSLSSTGLQAWSSIGHEAGGHHFLRSIPGLIQELSEKLEKRLDENEKVDKHFVSYFPSCIEELASDVLGVLNLGPAFGIGHALYLRAKNKDDQFSTKGVLYSKEIPPSRDIKLKSQSFKNDLLIEKVNPNINFPDSGNFGYLGNKSVDFEKFFNPVNKHPMDLLRVWVIVGVIEELDIDAKVKKDYIDTLNQIVDVDLKGVKKLRFKEIKKNNEVDIHEIGLDVCIEISKIAAKIIVSMELKTLNKYNFKSVVVWNNIDELIVKDLKKSLTGDKEFVRSSTFGQSKKWFSRHIVSASILKSISVAQEDAIFKKMKHWLRDEARRGLPKEMVVQAGSSSEIEITLGSEESTFTISEGEPKGSSNATSNSIFANSDSEENSDDQ